MCARIAKRLPARGAQCVPVAQSATVFKCCWPAVVVQLFRSARTPQVHCRCRAAALLTLGHTLKPTAWGGWVTGRTVFFWGSPATGLRWPHLAHANAWRICWLSLPGGVAGQATPPPPPPLSTSWRAPGSCATRPSPARSLKGSPANPHRWFTTPPGPPPEKNGLGPILGPSGVIFSGFQPGIPSVSWCLGGGQGRKWAQHPEIGGNHVFGPWHPLLLSQLAQNPGRTGQNRLKIGPEPLPS